ncbi:hypothetical protein CLV59_105133 [Chitinophaga dinghuensis]|uniref:Sulfotransferase family protein n=1 Tax=Chitinophaga dinghuensis TaxID=1539050 RepID=A0A327VYL5_9BACT|nr:hypothetical protein [Chitinophaga dinghuensis]RAJ80026.1 hypothetical protein CLV59_105133 [Chitinophaga dinghuensis]
MQISGNSIPYQTILTGPAMKFEWLDAAQYRFTQPFFHNTIQELKKLQAPAFRQVKCVSTAEDILEWTKELPPPDPAAIIFHVSRCGSTTISQMLAEDEENLILSEVAILDDVLRLPYMPDITMLPPREQLFKSLVALLSKPRTGKEKRVFIKLDSWHLFFYEELRQWFPNTPFMLLYRHPAEVVRSQMKQHGLHFFRGVIPAELMGCTWEELPAENPAYISFLIDLYLRKMAYIHSRDSNTFLVNYKDGNEGMLDELLCHSHYQPSPPVKEAMLQRAVRHGKYPDQSFQPEPQILDIPDYLAQACRSYEELNANNLNCLII